MKTFRYLVPLAGAVLALGYFMVPGREPVAKPSGPPPTPPPGAGALVAESVASPAGARATPEEAVDTILRLPAPARLNAATELLLALADQPDLATRFVRNLTRQDAVLIREHGATLVTILTAHGDFAGAVVFAELGGPERPLWLGQALAAWAHEDPALAARAALAELDGEGFPEVAAIWARTDPGALAAFARDLPEGFPRTLAFDRLRSANPD